MSKVWVLIITKGVDDYKHRGSCAESKVFLAKTKDICEKHLECAMSVYIDRNIIESEDDEKIDYVKNNFHVDDYGHWRLNDCSKMKEVYDEVTEGEYIPNDWTYEIKELTVNSTEDSTDPYSDFWDFW